MGLEGQDEIRHVAYAVQAASVPARPLHVWYQSLQLMLLHDSHYCRDAEMVLGVLDEMRRADGGN